jgi:chromatin modification-related protein VID21
MRQKSVSEILGETRKPSAPEQNVTPTVKRPASTQASPAGAESRDRGKPSTVVFSKDRDPASTKALNTDIEGYLALQGASLDPEKDYLRPLFLNQAWGPPRATPLPELLASARKTVTTSDLQANLRETLDYRILRRIYQLQNANKWSLRQMAKYPDPTPPLLHWDYLLQSMKWMRTDFREERRWKMATARNMADWCSVYVAAPEAVRQHLRVKAARPTRVSEKIIRDSFDEPPGLVPSTSTGSSEISEDEAGLATSTVAPTALFSLGYDDVIFTIDHTPAGDQLLAELPMYESKPLAPSSASNLPMSSNNTLIPVSRLATGKLVPKMNGVRKKRKRFDYETDEDDSSSTLKKAKTTDSSPFLSPARRSSPKVELPPEEQDIALFNPVNKHIRDRLHATHAFRPPSEFPMPTKEFFEARPQSQWLWDEDQRLRNCVRKYSYNWSLISMELQAQCQSSKFISGIERRTPWECFERWYHLEGLPNDMNRTTYFRTYQSRLDSANHALAAQAAAAQALPQTSQPPHQAVQRRRTSSIPVRVDRRREIRHVFMIHAISKLARKRETLAHRQQEGTFNHKSDVSHTNLLPVAKAAALRKAHSDNATQRPAMIHTPQQFSRLKHEREARFQEKQELYRRQMLEQQRVSVANLYGFSRYLTPGLVRRQ